MTHAVNRVDERRLSDFFGHRGDGALDVLFADTRAVTEAVAGGSDPQLYSAIRNVLPPRVSRAGAEATVWSADLVTYQHGTLPGGEPFRSTGHWNPPDQLEIFQVLSGRALLLSSVVPDAGDEPRVYFQECRAGELAVVPFGAWHLTYVLDGPAMVFNIYSGPVVGREDRPAHSGSGKYRSYRGPAGITATRSGAGYTIALSDSWQQASAPVEVSCPAWLEARVGSNGMLAELYVSGSDDDLTELLAAAGFEVSVGRRSEAP